MKNVEGLFFGQNRQLFGLYHPSLGQPRNHAVVVSGPLFHEYYRSHFAMRRIATNLAQSGYDVLRFDYSGMADSRNGLPEKPFTAWSNDIGEALTEVRELSGCTQVSLVAFRYSAALSGPWHAEQVI